jgi:hypothetical protein
MDRLPRPAEIAEAAEDFFGESVHHDGRASGRRALAKATYWQALNSVGYSTGDIARMTGAHHASVLEALSKAVPLDYVETVLKKAEKMAASAPF